MVKKVDSFTISRSSLIQNLVEKAYPKESQFVQEHIIESLEKLSKCGGVSEFNGLVIQDRKKQGDTEAKILNNSFSEMIGNFFGSLKVSIDFSKLENAGTPAEEFLSMFRNDDESFIEKLREYWKLSEFLAKTEESKLSKDLHTVFQKQLNNLGGIKEELIDLWKVLIKEN